MELQNTGKHYSEPTCRQKDFLPITCSLCQKIFCQQHQDPKAHHCSNQDLGDHKALVCPLCNKTLRLEVGKETEEQVWNRHERTECRASNKFKGTSAQSQVCSADGCRTKLTSVNEYECKKCRKRVCLKHRFEEDHECVQVPPGPKKAIEKNRKEIKIEESVAHAPKPQRNKPKKGFFEKVVNGITCGGCGKKKKSKKESNIMAWRKPNKITVCLDKR